MIVYSLEQGTGERIKRTLHYRGITQKEFFENTLNEKKTTYSKWLSGENKIPIEKLIAIAKALNCTTDFLLGLRPTADRAGEGVGSILNRLGYEVDFPSAYEEIMIISKNRLSFTCNRDDLLQRIDHLLQFEMYCLEKKEEANRE